MTRKQMTKLIPWNLNILILLSIFLILLPFALLLIGQPLISGLLSGALSSILAMLLLEFFQELKLRQAYSKLDGEGWEGFVIKDGEETKPQLRATGYFDGMEINQEISVSLNYLHSNLFTIKITATHSFEEPKRTIDSWGDLVMDKDNTLRGLLSLQNQKMNNYEVTFHNVLYWENDESQYIYLVNTKSLVSLKNNVGGIPLDMLYKRKKNKAVLHCIPKP